MLTPQEAEAGAGWSDWLGELARERRATLLTISVTPAQAGVQGGRSAPGALGSRLRGNDDDGARLWVAAERLPQFAGALAGGRLDPPIAAPTGHAERDWSPEEALIEILRGRLEGLGPVSEAPLRRRSA